MTIENSTWLIWSYQYLFSLGLCTLFLAYIIMMTKKKARINFPPGPKGLPILGYLPFLTRYKHLDFMELGKKYGDIFSVKLGSQDAVIMQGGDAVIEALNNPDLFGRAQTFWDDKRWPLTIFFGSDFKGWKEHRKFVVHSVKDFGLGKTKLEQAIMDEINLFMNVIRSYNAEPRDVQKEFLSSLTNNMLSLVLGKRFEYDSPELNLILDSVIGGFQNSNPVSPRMAFPWLIYIPLSNTFFMPRKIRNLFKAYKIYLRKEITTHEETIDSAFARDLIDQYFIEMNTRREKNQETFFNHKRLSRLIDDLLFAGIGTVHTAILWFIYILAAFPEVQKEVQREILIIIGSEKTPELSDMKKMPYTHAVLLETMRWKTLASLGIPRCALNDTIVEGYVLPKGTVVFQNFWAIHHDPRYWVEPEKFKPERFLSSDGMSIVRSKYLMPFSRGGRGCPGESLAISEIFLYCTSILKEFNVVFPDGMKPNFQASYTVSYHVDPYLVRFIPKS